MMLLLSVIISLAALATRVEGCDTDASLTCVNNHLKNLNPAMENFCDTLPNTINAFTACMEAAMQGCDASVRDVLKKALDASLQQMAQFNSRCSGGGGGGGGGPQPTQGDCSGMQTCMQDMAKLLGITLDANGQPSAEDQQRLTSFNPMGSVQDPMAFCGTFSSSSLKMGSALECMQRETKKCTGMDPFAVLAQLFGGSSSGGTTPMPGATPMPGMEMAAQFMAPLNQHLRMIRPDGSINGTGWDIFMAYACHPGCRGDFMANMSSVISQCTTSAMQSGQANCGDYQTAMECYTNKMGECPIMKVMLYGMKDNLVPAELKTNCNLNIDVALPTIPPEFLTGTTKQTVIGDGDNSGAMLAASVLTILTATLLAV